MRLFSRLRSERRLQEALAAWNAGDYGVALDLWAPLAQAGVARAQSNMGAAFLEGRGVAPDVVVPFDVRYADGKDPQLEKANSTLEFFLVLPEMDQMATERDLIVSNA